MSPARIERTFVIPAKAMLFGEYGVLDGGPALVATLPERRFILSAELKDEAPVLQLSGSDEPVALVFESDFFAAPLRFDRKGHPLGRSEQSQQGETFVSRLCSFLVCEFATRMPAESCLFVRVVDAFSPALGLGSSSALVAGLHRAFDESLPESSSSALERAGAQSGRVDLERAWPNLLGALRAAQGKGSGYDVAIQYLASRQDELDTHELWIFEPGEHGPLVRRIEAEYFWEQAGLLLPTGMNAPTGEILRRAGDSVAFFAPQHAALAREAIARLSQVDLWREEGGKAHPFADLFDRSFAIALEQGIAPSLEMVFPDRRPPSELAIKTMGAGCGDSLWVIDRLPEQGTTRQLEAYARTEYGALSPFEVISLRRANATSAERETSNVRVERPT